MSKSKASIAKSGAEVEAIAKSDAAQDWKKNAEYHLRNKNSEGHIRQAILDIAAKATNDALAAAGGGAAALPASIAAGQAVTNKFNKALQPLSDYAVEFVLYAETIKQDYETTIKQEEEASKRAHAEMGIAFENERKATEAYHNVRTAGSATDEMKAAAEDTLNEATIIRTAAVSKQKAIDDKIKALKEVLADLNSDDNDKWYTGISKACGTPPSVYAIPEHNKRLLDVEKNLISKGIAIDNDIKAIGKQYVFAARNAQRAQEKATRKEAELVGNIKEARNKIVSAQTKLDEAEAVGKAVKDAETKFKAADDAVGAALAALKQAEADEIAADEALAVNLGAEKEDDKKARLNKDVSDAQAALAVAQADAAKSVQDELIKKAKEMLMEDGANDAYIIERIKAVSAAGIVKKDANGNLLLESLVYHLIDEIVRDDKDFKDNYNDAALAAAQALDVANGDEVAVTDYNNKLEAAKNALREKIDFDQIRSITNTIHNGIVAGYISKGKIAKTLPLYETEAEERKGSDETTSKERILETVTNSVFVTQGKEAIEDDKEQLKKLRDSFEKFLPTEDLINTLDKSCDDIAAALRKETDPKKQQVLQNQYADTFHLLSAAHARKEIIGAILALSKAPGDPENILGAQNYIDAYLKYYKKFYPNLEDVGNEKWKQNILKDATKAAKDDGEALADLGKYIQLVQERAREDNLDDPKFNTNTAGWEKAFEEYRKLEDGLAPVNTKNKFKKLIDDKIAKERAKKEKLEKLREKFESREVTDEKEGKDAQDRKNNREAAKPGDDELILGRNVLHSLFENSAAWSSDQGWRKWIKENKDKDPTTLGLNEFERSVFNFSEDLLALDEYLKTIKIAADNAGKTFTKKVATDGIEEVLKEYKKFETELFQTPLGDFKDQISVASLASNQDIIDGLQAFLQVAQGEKQVFDVLVNARDKAPADIKAAEKAKKDAEDDREKAETEKWQAADQERKYDKVNKAKEAYDEAMAAIEKAENEKIARKAEIEALKFAINGERRKQADAAPKAAAGDAAAIAAEAAAKALADEMDVMLKNAEALDIKADKDLDDAKVKAGKMKADIDKARAAVDKAIKEGDLAKQDATKLLDSAKLAIADVPNVEEKTYGYEDYEEARDRLKPGDTRMMRVAQPKINNAINPAYDRYSTDSNRKVCRFAHQVDDNTTIEYCVDKGFKPKPQGEALAGDSNNEAANFGNGFPPAFFNVGPAVKTIKDRDKREFFVSFAHSNLVDPVSGKTTQKAKNYQNTALLPIGSLPINGNGGGRYYIKVTLQVEDGDCPPVHYWPGDVTLEIVREVVNEYGTSYQSVAVMQEKEGATTWHKVDGTGNLHEEDLEHLKNFNVNVSAKQFQKTQGGGLKPVTEKEKKLRERPGAKEAGKTHPLREMRIEGGQVKLGTGQFGTAPRKTDHAFSKRKGTNRIQFHKDPIDFNRTKFKFSEDCDDKKFAAEINKMIEHQFNNFDWNKTDKTINITISNSQITNLNSLRALSNFLEKRGWQIGKLSINGCKKLNDISALEQVKFERLGCQNCPKIPPENLTNMLAEKEQIKVSTSKKLRDAVKKEMVEGNMKGGVKVDDGGYIITNSKTSKASIKDSNPKNFFKKKDFTTIKEVVNLAKHKAEHGTPVNLNLPDPYSLKNEACIGLVVLFTHPQDFISSTDANPLKNPKFKENILNYAKGEITEPEIDDLMDRYEKKFKELNILKSPEQQLRVIREFRNEILEIFGHSFPYTNPKIISKDQSKFLDLNQDPEVDCLVLKDTTITRSDFDKIKNANGLKCLNFVNCKFVDVKQTDLRECFKQLREKNPDFKGMIDDKEIQEIPNSSVSNAVAAPIKRAAGLVIG
ncbi:MAG: hypothetical protein K0R25_734 [Rickettsiaceae bacterium]|jgi:hypothetical protein|nr:hypothetical protein [Rickettsiaceae bacterium]